MALFIACYKIVFSGGEAQLVTFLWHTVITGLDMHCGDQDNINFSVKL